MSNGSATCSCVIDCSGLYALATTRSNSLKAILFDLLQKGVIAVPVCAWNEFEELFEDEASVLAPVVTTKISIKKAYRVGAASIAEKLNSGFSRGPYDRNGDLYTASIAIKEGYTVLTSSSQLSDYKKMDCNAADLATWATNLKTDDKKKAS